MVVPLSLERWARAHAAPPTTGDVADLRLMVETLLEAELQHDDATRWLLHPALQRAIVDSVVATIRQLCASEPRLLARLSLAPHDTPNPDP